MEHDDDDDDEMTLGRWGEGAFRQSSPRTGSAATSFLFWAQISSETPPAGPETRASSADLFVMMVRVLYYGVGRSCGPGGGRGAD